MRFQCAWEGKTNIYRNITAVGIWSVIEHARSRELGMVASGDSRGEEIDDGSSCRGTSG